jgi:hypothetical protein
MILRSGCLLAFLLQAHHDSSYYELQALTYQPVELNRLLVQVVFVTMVLVYTVDEVMEAGLVIVNKGGAASARVL